ncbi:uncharacterized protein BX664DRAFT_340578 [Halteromyces radiatus]|uniref:uncharacterized protein n=1 Tax=Halteromyces radiatus TaxID=101107 RepID=UPI00221FA729|nr:uncharacterized protein BX664DRAFT_340578 [Halteromyces radiatus]KAI8081508.1 hypothetical protein BX664DRAFT_340578 [Halteromyces radiatus]
MESFLSTLPPYVHQYINKYPPTECFTVLKELICFAVLYSNDRERINLLSVDLLQKGADEAIAHKPYYSSSLSSLASTPMLASPVQTSQQLVPSDIINKTMPSILKQQEDQPHLECKPIMEEDDMYSASLGRPALGSPTQEPTQHSMPSSSSPPVAGKPSEKSTMPYTFPEWWGHHDTDNITKGNNNDNNNNTKTTSNDQLSVSERKSTTKEMNITTWIPVELDDTPKSNRNSSRPTSVHNPTIPDLRSYLDSSKGKKSQVQQTKDSAKATRRMSAPVPPRCESPITVTPSKQVIKSSVSPTGQKMSRTPSIKSSSSSVTSSPPPTALSRSSSTRTTSSTASTYRPGQTATVRARAEAAKQRQLQLEEEKRKQAASLTSRTSLRLKQQATSGIDWDAIKKGRRKTMPASSTAATVP